MGPYFQAADRSADRKRLPDGYVAVLDDADRLWRVMLELHDYAVAGGDPVRPRIGVLFRRVRPADRLGVARRLIDLGGPADVLGQLALFGIDERYHFVLDSEGVTHVWRRHGDPAAESQLGQVPIVRADFDLIPDVVGHPRHIVEFAVTKRVPRIVYERPVNDGTLRVVIEVQHGRRWLVVRTAYKRK